MEKSKLEKLSDSAIIRYYNFIYPMVIQSYRGSSEISEFYPKISDNNNLFKKIFTPIAGGSRMDIEYIWCLIKYNNEEKIEGDVINRPENKERTVDYVVEETKYVTDTYSENMSTYLDVDDFDSSYLWSLRENDEIYPWEWTNVDSETNDSEVTDEEFIIVKLN
jgi:hypothetical protein